MTLPKKLKIKGPKFGYCNICRNYGKLTYDHVPPKGCVPIKPIEIRTLSQEFYGKKLKATISQNGVKYRSICEECNNTKLGANYDLELIRLTDEVKQFLKAKIETGIHFPLHQLFKINTHKLLRAVIGHNLAGFVPEDASKPLPKGLFPDALRSYFLNENHLLDPRIRVYCWLFPVHDQIHLRNFAKKSWYRDEILMWDLLKFFPLAYWIVWDQPKSFKINLSELTTNRNKKLDDSGVLRIDFSNIPKRGFPETPEEDEFILGCDQQTSYSKYRNKKYKFL